MELTIDEVEKLIIDKPKCCNKDMFRYGSQNMIDGGESVIYVCLECGAYFQMTESQLDEEEVENYKEIMEGEKDADERTNA